MRIKRASHYFHAIAEGEALPALEARLAPLCRERFRRIDRFIQLSLLGSAECVTNLSLEADCGLYIASGIGPVGNNIVVQETLWKQHKVPMPFNFVNTLGSSAGYYVAKNLNLSGQSLFISRRGDSFEAALDCAAADLESGVVACALVGAVEECTLPLNEHRMRQALPDNEPLAEGSHWLLLEAGSKSAGERIEMKKGDLAFHDSLGAARITREASVAAPGSLGLFKDGNSKWSLAKIL